MEFPDLARRILNGEVFVLRGALQHAGVFDASGDYVAVIRGALLGGRWRHHRLRLRPVTRLGGLFRRVQPLS